MKHDLDQALRHAAEPVPSRVAHSSARKLVDDIVRSEPDAAAVLRPVKRRRLSPVMAGAALAVAAAAALMVNGVGADRAYASWTPDPSPLPAAEAQEVVDLCLGSPASRDARVAISERRGDYAFVNALTAQDTRTCFRDRDGRVHETSIMMEPAGPERLGRQGIELYAWPQVRTGEEGYVRIMAGRLGSQVDRVVITVDGAETRTVRATVRNGYFAAWYPEGREESSRNHTTLTLHLTDGRTVGGVAAGALMEAPILD